MLALLPSLTPTALPAAIPRSVVHVPGAAAEDRFVTEGDVVSAGSSVRSSSMGGGGGGWGWDASTKYTCEAKVQRALP
eukprot:1151602-Pelagomonas_calceolata.AAC.9